MNQVVRLLSYNIQVGIPTRRAHQYLTHSWKHFVPHAGRRRNLDQIAEVLAGHDIVGLQESDAGSLRSGFVNLTEYLARKAGFPYWHHHVNRRIGGFAHHAQGLISRLQPGEVETYGLPGLVPGRNVTVARYGAGDEQLAIFHAHLGLTRRVRRSQLAFIAELLGDYPHAVVMGDFNAPTDSVEMRELFRRTELREPEELLYTFPSWKPRQNIDHVLVTSSLGVRSASVLQHDYSDHLPLAVEIGLPGALRLA